MTAAPTTRLHITPLTPDILPSVLPASLRSVATDVSFHTIPTFPENDYGYVTLPTMEADKIKKKLNGSILKGKKFKVETARPDKRQRNEEEDAVSGVKPGAQKKSKKRPAEDGVLDGYELPSDRKVKRGWTDSANAKKERRKSEKKKGEEDKKKTQPKSKYSEKDECLFRTTIPPNRSLDVAAEKKAKKRKKSSHESVVHEFAKTVTHPSFLRSAEEGGAPTTTFEDGKGWVDSTGHVKEAASEKIGKDSFRPGKIAGAKDKRQAGKAPGPKELLDLKVDTSDKSSAESEDWTSSSGSSDGESTDSESDEDTSSSSDDLSAPSPETDALKPQARPTESTEPADAATITPSKSDSEESEPAQEADQNPSPREVHPLEALFKRPAPSASESHPPPEANAGFSFFNTDDMEPDEDVPQIADPQTPSTKKELQTRSLRSAAPTPDTALASRLTEWTGSDNMEDDEGSSMDTPVSKSRGMETGANKEDSEFVQWFWEHRGENNRAWKKRRRDAAKEQRQRENRKKGLKGKS